MQEKKKKEKVQSLCMPQHNHGRMIPHVGSSCIFIGFLLPPSLTFVSVSELICHGSWFCVFLTQYQLIFLEGWWEIQYGHVFFLFGFYQPYQLVCSYMVGLFIFFFFFPVWFLVLGLYLLLCYSVRCYVVFFLGGDKVFFPTHAIVVGTGRLPLGRKGAQKHKNHSGPRSEGENWHAKGTKKTTGYLLQKFVGFNRGFFWHVPIPWSLQVAFPELEQTY